MDITVWIEYRSAAHCPLFLPIKSSAKAIFCHLWSGVNLPFNTFLRQNMYTDFKTRPGESRARPSLPPAHHRAPPVLGVKRTQTCRSLPGNRENRENLLKERWRGRGAATERREGRKEEVIDGTGGGGGGMKGREGDSGRHTDRSASRLGWRHACSRNIISDNKVWRLWLSCFWRFDPSKVWRNGWTRLVRRKGGQGEKRCFTNLPLYPKRLNE